MSGIETKLAPVVGLAHAQWMSSVYALKAGKHVFCDRSAIHTDPHYCKNTRRGGPILRYTPSKARPAPRWAVEARAAAKAKAAAEAKVKAAADTGSQQAEDNDEKGQTLKFWGSVREATEKMHQQRQIAHMQKQLQNQERMLHHLQQLLYQQQQHQ